MPFPPPLLSLLSKNALQAAEFSGTPAFILHTALASLATESPLICLLPTMEACQSARPHLPNAVVLPDLGCDPYGSLPSPGGLVLARALALQEAIHSQKTILTTPAGVWWRVPPPQWWRRRQWRLVEGETISRPHFLKDLWCMGYRRTERVSQPGEFSSRGGIVDIFPPDSPLPVRLELFGDEIDRLCFFEPGTQRSQGKTPEQLVLPALMECFREEELEDAYAAAWKGAGSLGDSRLECLQREVFPPLWNIEARAVAPFVDLEALLPGHQWVEIRGAHALAQNQLKTWKEQFAQSSKPPFLSPKHLFSKSLPTFSRSLGIREGSPSYQWRHPDPVNGHILSLVQELRHFHSEGWRTILSVKPKGLQERLAQVLGDESLPLMREISKHLPPSGVVTLLNLDLQQGLHLCEEKVAIWGEEDLFGSGVGSLSPSPIRNRQAFFSQVEDLRVGQHVVHIDHGIARFSGLEHVRGQDFLILHYSQGARLLVPVTKMDRVQPYVGPEGRSPALDRLGGEGWLRTRKKAQKAVSMAAEELLRLYAIRMAAEGHAFPPDGPWQDEFESAFPYPLTPDQKTTLASVKKDMENAKPMDRLVCGDVGFGKTEIAMRSAFKAVNEDFQVVVLCPTTVLALQHHRRFQTRFSPFEIPVEMISRLRPPKELRSVLQRAEKGEPMVLVGTHRLLAKGVKLPRLGLLVVDEEQRFGVRHKERIKSWNTHVDVLTLTATPIPRTLQMGLAGLREMSLIRTPPRDRMAIQTLVTPYSEETATMALNREIHRGGQVFYVHPRAEALASVAIHLEKLHPGIQVVTAHGRMAKKQLEDAMLAFYKGEAQVLVCTTIIENGVDIPNANTLFVEQAHRFGLTQLYQLRGRIGRSRSQAYAYLSVPEDLALSEDAQKRLEALREFSELGAGFRVAALDLEMRGAGHLLGVEQTGHMAAIGFELFLRMLEDEVARMRGDYSPPPRPVEIRLPVESRIPEDYISEITERLKAYRKMATVRNEAEIQEYMEEWKDRYGPSPIEVSNLAQIARLRLRAAALGIRSVGSKKGELSLDLAEDTPLKPENIVAVLATHPGCRFLPSGILIIPDIAHSPKNILSFLAELAL